MKIVKIIGGLGNQMFQYALYIALHKTFPEESIAIDTSCFHGYNLHNGFELNKIFPIQANEASFKNIIKVGYYYPNYHLWQIGRHLLPKRKNICLEKKDLSYDESILTQKGNRYFDGYWQNEKYFNIYRHDVLKNFTFKPFDDEANLKLSDLIKKNKSVSIHVRRGDYTNNTLYKGICDIEYYKNAIKKAKDLTTPNLFCIFSNDITWCKKNLYQFIDAPIIYVNWNFNDNSFKDMQLMTYCNINIIANSSFSWWGAWLNCNPDKIVIAPKTWINLKNNKFSLPQSWTKI